MKINTDIDIDVANRDKLLSLIPHTNAAMLNVNPIRRHPSGIYVTDIPYDPVNDMASIDYTEAEKRGYFKIDILNVHVYEQVKDEEHLIRLMQEPDWSMLDNYAYVKELVHLNNSYKMIKEMPEPIDSIPRLAMFLAIIRPGKKHLIGLPWKEVAKTVWDKEKGEYTFRKSHAIAYAHLVVIHMNLLKGIK
jgi:hypothetical protein